LDLPALLRGLQEVLSHTLGAGIAVSVKLGADLPPIKADKRQLETVLVNLATNARDAMTEGGRLVLSAEAEIVSAQGPRHSAGVEPGSYVRLSVSDTGIGMNAETLARAREPFFTTKKLGAGTGLGLAMAQTFAEQSGGALSLESRESKGTTVTLWLRQADVEDTGMAGGPAPGAFG
jgi:signal transduction histidine kinase